MKKFNIIFILLFTLGAFTANAQSVKIGYVDYLDVIDSLPSKLKADGEIKSFLDDGQKTILQMQEQLEQDIKDYQKGKDTISEFVRERKENQLMEQQQLIQYKSESLEQDLQILNQRLYEPIETMLTIAIKNVANKFKVTYILEVNSLLYFDSETGLDLTNEVKAEMMRLEAEK